MSMWGLSCVGGAARAGPMSMWGLSCVGGAARVRASKSGPFGATFGRKRPLFRPNGPPGGKAGPPGQIPGAAGRFPAENHGKGPAREMGRPERRGATPRNVGPPRVMRGRPE